MYKRSTCVQVLCSFLCDLNSRSSAPFSDFLQAILTVPWPLMQDCSLKLRHTVPSAFICASRMPVLRPGWMWILYTAAKASETTERSN
jgi:hypothetical protein